MAARLAKAQVRRWWSRLAHKEATAGRHGCHELQRQQLQNRGIPGGFREGEAFGVPVPSQKQSFHAEVEDFLVRESGLGLVPHLNATEYSSNREFVLLPSFRAWQSVEMHPFFSPLPQCVSKYSSSAQSMKRDDEDKNAEHEQSNAEHEQSKGDPSHDESGDGTGWTMREMITWPNSISLSRLVLGPVLAWVVVQGLPGVAFCGMVIGGFSDWLDGYVARRTNVKSVLGSYLDPLADKVLVGSVALSMAYVGLLHPALVGLMVARDAALVVGAALYRAWTLQWKWNGWSEFFKINAGGAPKMQPIFISKVNTVLQLALICAALLEPTLSALNLHAVVWYLSWSVAATTLGSWIGYVLLYYRRPEALGSVLSKMNRPGQRVKQESVSSNKN